MLAYLFINILIRLNMKNIRVVFLIINSLLSLSTDAQKFGWTNHLLKTDGTMHWIDLEIDKKGNYIGIVEFLTFLPELPGVTMCNKYIPPFDNYGSMIIYLDKKGNCLWTHTLHSDSGAAGGLYISIDKGDNFYLSGSFIGKINLAPGIFLDSGSPQNSYSFIAKYDSKGELVWYKTLKVKDPSKTYTVISGIENDSSENLYLLLDHGQEILFFENQIVQNNHMPLKYFSRILKLDKEGNLIWSKLFESEYGSPQLKNLKSDHNGNIIILGTFIGKSMKVDSQEIINSYQGNLQKYDGFIIKFSCNGDVLWLHSFGGKNTDDYGSGLEIDLQDNIYLTIRPSYSGPFELFDTLITDTLLEMPSCIAKLNSDGIKQWFRVYDFGVSNNNGYVTAIDKKNQLHIAWSLTKDSIKIEEKVLKRINKGQENQYDMIYLIIDTSGRIVSLYSWGGEKDDIIYNIVVLPNGEITISGGFSSDTLTLGEHSLYKFANKPTGNLTSDGFIANISPDVMVGSKDVRKQESNLISIHPNPARDLIQIQFDEELHADGHIEILTTTGTLMMFLHINKGSTSTNVDVRNWPAGIYLVRYRDMEGRSSVERMEVE